MGWPQNQKTNKREKAKKISAEVQIEKIIGMLSRLTGSKRKESQISCKIAKRIKSNFKNSTKTHKIDYEEEENSIHKRRTEKTKIQIRPDMKTSRMPHQMQVISEHINHKNKNKFEKALK